MTQISKLSLWLEQPAACYEAWLAEQHTGLRNKFSPSTRKVYLSMFAKFSEYLDKHNIRLDHCDEMAIKSFFVDSQIKKHQRYRYIRLIERVYDHLITNNPEMDLPNPARRAAKQKIAAGANDPMTFLSAAQIAGVTAFLAEPIFVEERGKKIKKREWKKSRDRAITAIMLFGAVKVSEVCALTVNCVSVDFKEILINPAKTDSIIGKIVSSSKSHAPDRGGETVNCVSELLPGKPHIAKMLDHAPCLQEWLVMRNQVGFAGDYLFPSSPEGKPMHPASLYRGVLNVLRAAGLNVDQESRLSPQTLRNTYAILMFEQGHHELDIKNSMGMVDVLSVLRIKTYHNTWCSHNEVHC